MILAAALFSLLLAPGTYDRAGHPVYVGVTHDLPGPAGNDFFDPQNQHTGALQGASALRLRSVVREERHSITTPQGRLGYSLYFADATPRATVILIHGNDPETREMGFIIPYFVANGVNVVSYDQRGTGVSAGNWFLNGPVQRAQDVDAIYDALLHDAHVAAHRIGVWGFSNGGWTAPIVSVDRPIAFMILKSAPAESLKSNLDYEVVAQMHRHGHDAASTNSALALWHAVEDALKGTQSWESAKRLYDADKKQSWFADSLMIDLTFPLSASLQDGLRRFITYDPAQTLRRVTVPTLALYGALDRNVDAADSSKQMRRFSEVHVYSNAGHQLIVSKTGYNGDRVPPAHFVPGYPQIMVTWLGQHGFTAATKP